MRVTQVFTFEAAHRLTNVPDTHKCKRLHGHSYRVELTFEGRVDAHTGFVVDFFDVEKEVKPLIDQLDHHFLNEVPGLEIPTVENLVLWFREKVPGASWVRVYETPMCWAEA